MRSCTLVKFQALIVMLEHFECDELTRAPCRSLMKFDVFDQKMKVKVAEIFSALVNSSHLNSSSALTKIHNGDLLH